MSRHRAILAKLALAWVGIASAIRPAAGDGKVLVYQEGDAELLVNVTDRPGKLTVVGQGSPPSHTSHPTPPASPRVPTAPLQETHSYDPRQVVGGLASARGGSAPSLAMLAGNSGGAASVVRSSGISTATAGYAVAADTAESASAEVFAGGESSSGNSVLKAGQQQRAGAGSTAGFDSPRVDGGSGKVPLDPFGRSNGGGGGAMTPPRSISPAPTTFINRMPNPFTTTLGAAVPAPLPAMPTVVAWPFTQPEILNPSVRLHGHNHTGNVLPSRRRGDDGGTKDRADLLFLSTGSSGWGGGTGSFFGGEHFPHPMSDVPIHPRSPPPHAHPSLPVSTTSFMASSSDNQLALAMVPASLNAGFGFGVGVAGVSEGLPGSMSAPMPRAPAARRSPHDTHVTSASDGSSEMRLDGPASARLATAAVAINSLREPPNNGANVYTSPPARPPIAPRTSVSPPTGSPRRVTFDQAAEAALDRASSGRSVRSSTLPHAAPPDLRPDAAALQLSGLTSEEMPWWGGSSRMEGSIIMSERSRGSSAHGDAPGGSPQSARAAAAEADVDWAETPTSRTGKFPPIPEAQEVPPQAAALATAFGSGSRTSSSGDDWKWGPPQRTVEVGPPLAADLATAFSDTSSSAESDVERRTASPSKAAVLASPFGDSEDESHAGDEGPRANGSQTPVQGGTAAVLASAFGGDSSDDGGGMWGDGPAAGAGAGGGGGTAATLMSPFDDDDSGGYGGPSPPQQDRSSDAPANGVGHRAAGEAPWRKQASIRVGVVPSLMSPFGDDSDDEEVVPGWGRGIGASNDWETTESGGGRDALTSEDLKAYAADPQHQGHSDAAAQPPGRKPARGKGHRETYPFSRQPPSRLEYSSSTDDEQGGRGAGDGATLAAAAGMLADSHGPPSASAGGGGLMAEMSSAISLDQASAVLPSAEAHLRALVMNKSVHMMEAQFRMWINTSDITMTDEVIGRGSYGQVRARAPLWSPAACERLDDHLRACCRLGWWCAWLSSPRAGSDVPCLSAMGDVPLLPASARCMSSTSPAAAVAARYISCRRC